MTNQISGSVDYSSSNPEIILRSENQNYLTISGIGSLKINSISGIPTLTVNNPNAVPTQSIVGNNLSGRVTFTTGINNLAGKICEISFIPNIRDFIPNVLICPYNCTALDDQTYLYVNTITTSGFSVFDIGAAGNNNTYSFSYLVIDSYSNTV